MDSGSAALLGAGIGATASLAGSFGGSWLQARREARRGDRERLRENLYALQDAIDPVIGGYAAVLRTRWPRHDDTSFLPPGVASAVMRLNMISGRIGDDPLSEPLSKLLEALARAREAPTEQEAWETLSQAYDELFRPIQFRIALLLHTKTKIDYGVPRRRWWLFFRAHR